jgi:hypothetical protein
MMPIDDPHVMSCPRCGGDHLNWRLKRIGRFGRPSERTFVWHCRACSATWAEQIPPNAELDRDDNLPLDLTERSLLLELPADD